MRMLIGMFTVRMLRERGMELSKVVLDMGRRCSVQLSCHCFTRQHFEHQWSTMEVGATPSTEKRCRWAWIPYTDSTSDKINCQIMHILMFCWWSHILRCASGAYKLAWLVIKSVHTLCFYFCRLSLHVFRNSNNPIVTHCAWPLSPILPSLCLPFCFSFSSLHSWSLWKTC